MKKSLSLSVLMIAAAFTAAGCGGGTNASVSETRPVTEIATEAKQMAVDQLQKVITSYKTVIASKQADIQAVQDKIKQIPLTQLLGEEATKLKAEVTTIMASVSALTERMNVYINELKAKGGTL